ncbi:MAG: hypothetical protein LBG84_05110 [Treponema sp.]|jgi:hypothetical protein|nr:hypothetical protein [Treponema sp.]
MSLIKSDTVDFEKFWREYEEKTGETVLAKSLAHYLRGWAEFPEPLWGLAIATSGGFRFHHFPHEGWLTALSRLTSGGEPPKERTLFIPRERIVSAALVVETRWWKKLLAPAAPLLLIRAAPGEGPETELAVETDRGGEALVEALRAAAP